MVSWLAFSNLPLPPKLQKYRFQSLCPENPSIPSPRRPICSMRPTSNGPVHRNRGSREKVHPDMRVFCRQRRRPDRMSVHAPEQCPDAGRQRAANPVGRFHCGRQTGGDDGPRHGPRAGVREDCTGSRSQHDAVSSCGTTGPDDTDSGTCETRGFARLPCTVPASAGCRGSAADYHRCAEDQWLGTDLSRSVTAQRDASAVSSGRGLVSVRRSFGVLAGAECVYSGHAADVDTACCQCADGALRPGAE